MDFLQLRRSEKMSDGNSRVRFTIYRDHYNGISLQSAFDVGLEARKKSKHVAELLKCIFTHQDTLIKYFVEHNSGVIEVDDDVVKQLVISVFDVYDCVIRDIGMLQNLILSTFPNIQYIQNPPYSFLGLGHKIIIGEVKSKTID